MESPSPSIVRVSEIRKRFGENEILKGISLQVAEGDLVSIIGPSGCGKSTFLRCLNGLEVADSGSMEIVGTSLSRAPGTPPDPQFNHKMHTLRQRVGMVFQQFHLFPHLTIAENVMLAPRVADGQSPAAAAAEADRLLTKVGLADRADHYPSQLSGGQQQRAAIARALARKPRLMLYDEPTSALDPEMVDEVLSVMRALDEEGMTQIIVTHEMRFARDASDYIVFMEGGHIVEIADGEMLFTRPQDERTRRFLSRYL